MCFKRFGAGHTYLLSLIGCVSNALMLCWTNGLKKDVAFNQPLKFNHFDIADPLNFGENCRCWSVDVGLRWLVR